VPLCLIVYDYMVYSDPKSKIKSKKFRVRVQSDTIKKIKKQPQIFFLRPEADFFDPMLSSKAFATNSLK
jgi:hypothetical protein